MAGPAANEEKRHLLAVSFVLPEPTRFTAGVEPAPFLGSLVKDKKQRGGGGEAGFSSTERLALNELKRSVARERA